MTTPSTPFAVVQTSVSAKTSTTATIAVTTTRPATVSVRYGLSASALTSTAAGPATAATTQAVSLSGLKPRSRHHYQVIATSQTGQTSASAVYNFRTR